ncbi:MAG: hypothetical protein Q4G04_00170 [bacterium]|nr:hypothetical protein [bacterium]
MKVLLLDNEKIISLVLPLETKGNYWVVDSRGNKLVSIEGQNGSWKLLGNSETKIINAEQSSNLKLYTFYEIVNSIENLRYYIYTCEYYDKSFIQLLIKQGIKKIVIGNESKNIKRGDNPVESIDISYNNPIIEANQVQLVFENNYWRVSNLHKSIILYVNNIATTDRYLFNGDIVFIGGLIFSLVGDILLINNPSGLVQCNQRNFTTRSLPVMDFNIERKEQDYFLKMYKSEDYFFRPPRFKNSIEKVIIEIDDIPPKDTTEETPLIYVLGPMLAMGITSLTTGLFALLRVINGETTMINVAPTLIMAFAMMTGTLIFPALSKQYMKRKKLAKEEKRVKKYTEYIKNKSNEITAEIQKQKSILEENMPSLEECANIILKRKRNLWERKIEHEDFLQLRIGHGTSEPEIEIKSPKPRFEVEEDELKDVLQNVINQSTIMNDVPISLSLTENNISAIIGLYNITKTFLDGLILQMLTYHSYDDLKIIVFTNSFHKNKYDDIKHCPHCWNNEKTTRFFGTNINEINQISNYLEKH